eukprot:COSAG04_NODE_26437_length_295_cov_0.352041_2_plen_81_part_01
MRLVRQHRQPEPRFRGRLSPEKCSAEKQCILVSIVQASSSELASLRGGCLLLPQRRHLLAQLQQLTPLSLMHSTNRRQESG